MKTRRYPGRTTVTRASTKAQIAGLQQELKEALDRQTATGEILRVISSSSKDVHQVFDTIVQTGLTLFPEATLSIALKADKQVQAAAIAGPDPLNVEAWRGRFPAPLTRDSMHGFVILDGAVIDIPDVASSSDQFSQGAKNNFLASGYRAVTMIPIVHNGNAVGVLALLRLSPGGLEEEEFALFGNLRITGQYRH